MARKKVPDTFSSPGWSEIETLGRDQAQQRMLLDRMVPGLKAAIEQRELKRKELRKNRERIAVVIRDLHAKLEEDAGDVYRFLEYRKDFEDLDKAEVRECFQSIDVLETQRRIYDAVQSNCQALTAALATIEPTQLMKGIDDIAEKSGEAVGNWWKGEELRAALIVDGQQSIADELGKIKDKLQKLTTLITSRINAIDENLRTAYEGLRAILSGEPDKQKIADLRRNAKRRLERVSAVRDQYIALWIELRDLLNERRTIAISLSRAQEEVTAVRATTIQSVQEKLNQFMADRLKVSIRMTPGGDRSEFTSALENFLRAPQTRINKKLLASIPDKFTPATFGNLLLERRWDELKGEYHVGGADIVVSNTDVEKLKEIKDWHEKSEAADVERLTDEGPRLMDILQLQEVPWDDRAAILLNGQPVDKLSPGQRSSAMLPLIALAENTPLVIDQPEDNLDNRLIGQVLVDILAALKEHRQIIVCTHNPNIVVSGDAEQVIALQAESDREGKLDITGSIDSQDIVRTVVELMEGGREAFRMRRERYGI
jgi:hypothetical protein